MEKLKDCIEKLKKPNRNYRPLPFWSWNDRLEEDELRWQVKEQARVGLGGYFMHARGGLKTKYMSEEWMRCIQACIDEGKNLNMQSWIYDEYGWPSGFAGGDIPKMGIDYQQKFLKFEEIYKSCIKPAREVLGIYKCSDNYTRVKDLDSIADDEMVLQISYDVNPYYSDLLNPKVVKEFIKVTHDRYYQRFAEYFGKEIPGLFTDEPQYGRNAIPWSHIIPAIFQKKYGYNIVDYLPALYCRIPGYSKVRYDYWNLLTELFIEGFAKQIGEWCQQHNCQLTGHVLLEESMYYQTMCTGSAMGFYQYMQLPGIDWLGRRIGNPVIVKQVSSVANQLRKKQVISEMFGCAGWNTSFEDMKWIAEWQYALGVNLMCPHLEGYSLRGLRKRDYPPGLFYQSPWWKEYVRFNDYFARLGMFLTEGESQADILVIHPLRSGWMAFDASCCKNAPNKKLKTLDDQFVLLSEILSGLHFNYHYGDEGIMANHGCVENGRLIIGQCAYNVVIIPPSLTLDVTTIDLLKAFIAQGGKVYCFKQFPTLCQGRPSTELIWLRESCKTIELEKEDIEYHLAKTAYRPVRIVAQGVEDTTVLHNIRKYGDGYSVFLVNTDRELSHDIVLQMEWDGRVYRIDLDEGMLEPVPIGAKGSLRQVDLSLAPAQSCMFIVLEADSNITKTLPEQKMIHRDRADTKIILLDSEWQIDRYDLNALTLDYCRVKVGDGPWSEMKPVLTIQKELLSLGKNSNILLEYNFFSRFDFSEDYETYMVIEDYKDYEIIINGTKIPSKPVGWWRDKSFHKIDIGGKIKKGKNTILLRRYFHNSQDILEKLKRASEFEAEANMLTFDTEVESIYILGDFNVVCDNEFAPVDRDALIQPGLFYLDRPDRKKVSGDLTSTGFPFFSGCITLKQKIVLNNIKGYSKAVFQMQKPDAVLTKLYINGQEAKTFMWAPYEVDIRPYIQEGLNEVSIELISSNRNLLGPHHHPGGELYALGPMDFTEAPGWVDSYCFVKFGLNGQPNIIFK